MMGCMNYQMPHNPTCIRPRIRPSTYPPKQTDLYLPESDNSASYAFALGMHRIRTARGSKRRLLAGYFTALCAILPDLAEFAHTILTNHGFSVRIVYVSKFRVYNRKWIRRFDKIIEDLSLAQLMYLPFLSNFKGVGQFWKTVARNAGVWGPIYLLPEKDARTLHSALVVSGLIVELRTGLHLAQQEFASWIGTPYGLLFTEAAKWVDIERRYGGLQGVAAYDLTG